MTEIEKFIYECPCKERRAMLLTALDALLADKRRIDWLERNRRIPTGAGINLVGFDYREGNSLRDAIDERMQA